MLNKFFADEAKRAVFTAALDACHPGSAAEAITLFNRWWGDFPDEEVEAEIRAVIDNINHHADFVHSTDRAQVISTVFSMLVAAVVCLKHEGFREEREWRLIYGPKRNPSPLMEAESETRIIGAVPQLIYKMPLDASAAPEVAGLDVARIFDRLIIGPSQYSLAMHQVFTGALTKAGVADAGARVQ